jgi:polyhydroxyalkanoate synthesis regulator phasin
MTAKRKKATGWRQALPRQLNELQATVEKRVRKGLEEVTELLPPAPRKAVKRLTADVDRMRHDLRKRGDKVLADTRKRTERLTAEIQKRVEGAMTPLARSLDVASRSEVERLRKRLDHLEHRLETRAEHSSVPA